MICIFGEVFDVKTIAKNTLIFLGVIAALMAPILICALIIWALW